MKILHTSDWHLGRSLYGKKRYDEFAQFLAWLLKALSEQTIDVLLVAGDIFDTTTPSHKAQQLYYQFLSSVAQSHCRNVIIIAGNHDSPTFLAAPKALLQVLNVYVVSEVTPYEHDQVIVLKTYDNQPGLIICAVPYLRDSDVRVAQAYEDLAQKEQQLLAGIHHHYARIINKALLIKQQLGQDIPIIAMGHLFTAGGQTREDDGVRGLYVGALAHVSANMFPASVNYIALGHLHVPQVVMGCEWIRYSGSPIAMGFGEAKQQKSVCIVDFKHHPSPAEIRLLPVPAFQALAQVKGSMLEILAQIEQLKLTLPKAWLEVVYHGKDSINLLTDRLNEAIAGSQLVILSIKNQRYQQRSLTEFSDEATLSDLSCDEVFERCMVMHEISAEQRDCLRALYADILTDFKALT